MNSEDYIDEQVFAGHDGFVVPLRGEIQVIFGPMFSGKSTELVRRLKRYQIARHECLVIKYAKDQRYDEEQLATHDKHKFPAVAADKLEEVRDKAEHVSVIGIDEGQFFPDIVSFAEEMANMRKIVIIAALDGTFQRKAFGPILNLVPLAEDVMKLKAVCMMCFVRDASFTKRKGGETEVEIIGGTEKYLAVCRACHAKESCSPLKTPKRIPFTPMMDSKRARRGPKEESEEVVVNGFVKGENVETNSESPPPYKKLLDYDIRQDLPLKNKVEAD